MPRPTLHLHRTAPPHLSIRRCPLQKRRISRKLEANFAAVSCITHTVCSSRLLQATGQLGQQTLKVARKSPIVHYQSEYDVVGLAGVNYANTGRYFGDISVVVFAIFCSACALIATVACGDRLQ